MKYKEYNQIYEAIRYLIVGRFNFSAKVKRFIKKQKEIRKTINKSRTGREEYE